MRWVASCCRSSLHVNHVGRLVWEYGHTRLYSWFIAGRGRGAAAALKRCVREAYEEHEICRETAPYAGEHADIVNRAARRLCLYAARLGGVSGWARKKLRAVAGPLAAVRF